MPRDLLNVIRQNSGSNPFAAQSNEEFEMDEVDPKMKQFKAMVDTIESKIDKLQTCINQVRMKQAELISDPRQNERTKQELDELTDEIRKLATGVRTQIKQIELETQEMEARDPMDPYIQMHKSQLAEWSTHLKNVMISYSNAQGEHYTACKSQLKRKMEIAEIPVTDEKLNEMLESDTPQVFTQFSLNHTQQARQNLVDIEAQHSDIKKLEQNILEMQDVMQSLNDYVQDQGGMIDSIAAHVDNTVDYVAQAKQETNKAVVFQRSYNKKKWICIGVVIAIIVIIVIILLATLIK